MNLRLGDVVLVRFQFHQIVGSKVRPAVAILDSGDDDFVGALVTSRARRSEFDLTVSNWQPAGLNVPSVARLHKLGVLSKTDVLRTLGRLSRTDLDQLVLLLCRVYCPRQPGS